MFWWVCCFIIFDVYNEAAVPPGESFKFLVSPWAFVSDGQVFPDFKWKSVYTSDTVFMSCQTNDPKATVLLLRQKSIHEKYENAETLFRKPDGTSRLNQMGQNFTVMDITTLDFGHYTCNATSEDGVNEMLKLGQLFISEDTRTLVPQIMVNYDSNKTEHAITAGENENITCQGGSGTSGTENSYLLWYKRSNGVDSEVESSKVHREKHYSSNNVPIDIDILMFKNFQQADIGIYVCKRKIGTANSTEDTITITLRADEAPSVTFPDISEETVTATEGKPCVITCSAGGVPRPDLRWEKDGKFFKTCQKGFKTCDLDLSDGKAQHPDDSGVFTCVAKNRLGVARKNLTVVVQEKPVLEVPPEKVIAHPDEIREVECKAKEGNPLPTFSWEYRNETEERSWIPWNSEQYPVKNKQSSVSYITVPKSNATFSYRCTAINALDNDTAEFSVIRNDLAVRQFAIFPSTEYKVNEDDQFTINCQAAKDTYSNIVLETNGTVFQFSTIPDDNLHRVLYEVTSAEISQSGTYKCKATLNKLDIAMERSVRVKVKALQRPKITGFNHLSLLQDNVRDTNITCVVTGNPKPDIQWKFNGQLKTFKNIAGIDRCNITNQGTYLQSGKPEKLILCKLDFSVHQGLYTCIAKNKLTTIEASRELIVQASPEIKTESRITLTPTSPELYCDSHANPLANVTWVKYDSKNNKKILANGLKNASVLFSNLQQEDGGEYECFAVNKLGNASKLVTVAIAGLGASVSKEKQTDIVIGVVVAAVVVALIAFIIILYFKRHYKEHYAKFLEPNDNFTLDPDRSLFDQSSELPYDMTWEYPRDKLTFIKTLGSGAFGQVWLAEAEGIHSFNPRDKSASAAKRRKSFLKNRRYHTVNIRYRKHAQEPVELEKTMVAVKTLKDDAAETEYKDLASELKILIHLGEHKNIVNLLGACTRGGKLCVILECCPHGNLLNFLRSKREIFQPLWFKEATDMEKEFTYIDLLMTVFQVAKGMDFLQSKRCVHRDLAARNVLVGEDYIMKIADFGLARDIYKDEFYLKETTGLLPVKWMAPESLFDKVYTSSSDVWSFGILLWEVFTLGGSPYPGLPTEELFPFLEEGKRMDRPEICPKDVYEIMKSCWAKSPYDRPLFAHIVEGLSNVMKQNVPSSGDYLDTPDGASNPMNDYLSPSSPPRRVESEHLDAGGSNQSLVPKGKTYVPPPSNGNLKPGEEEDDLRFSPLPETPLLSGQEEYVPMTPANHYKDAPAKFDFGREAIV